MYTFVQLRPGTDPGKLEAKFPALVDKYKPQLKESHTKKCTKPATVKRYSSQIRSR